ncbi:hypothetical protein NA57DRAFT_47988 [Rhizodiscina lignyota]|uniref:Metallo-beta-lactamase domain-containing protein n=1 Tax=Rhizodiscina lignyota TaxID=1504668 RepID=A0A9P4I4B5_9PEZI|nr:hypothetical protein NA57DRAFT_47988 [Rhizodiscina lignyota]
MGEEPYFHVPAGEVAGVKIIDNTTRISKLASSFTLKPPVEGFDYFMNSPSWTFLIESPSGKKALFDLGVPKDWADMSPLITGMIKQYDWDINVEKDMADVLKEHGVLLDDIGSIIWSHFHWDHIGDCSTFPSSTDLVVGPGFKVALLPGYPAKEDSPVREKDFNRGRKVVEVDFETQQTVKLGDMEAIDFFGDGSFYLLDTPGHAIGHLAGLARTSKNPDTFIFMGGDLCHHAGEMRPSKYLPIPAEILPHPWIQHAQKPCPGALLENLQKSRGRAVDEPIYDPVMGHSMEETIETIKKAQEADGKDNIFFIFAHDDSLYGEVDLFPLSANQWKQKGWRQKLMWKFLKDFKQALELQQ